MARNPAVNRKQRIGEKGFALPMAMLLVIVLGISGLSFHHLDYLEKRMALGTGDDLSAFYLANAGIERARAVLKIDDVSLSWTPYLTAGSDTPAPDSVMIQPTDDPSLKYVIPQFGNIVTGSSGDLPFDGLFDDGQYQVRVFNNMSPGETRTNDLDGIVTIRALGTVRGEQKLVEVDIRAISGLKMVTWAVPNTFDAHQNATLSPSPGREPGQVSEIPTMDPPLTGPNSENNYYRLPANFPGLTVRIYTGTLEDNSYYFINGDVSIGDSADNVVIFSTGNADLSGNVDLTNAIIVGIQSVSINGNVLVTAMPAPGNLQYPAIISGGAIGADSSVEIFGTIYALGDVDFRPLEVHGVIISGGDISLQAAATFVSDDNNSGYYELMPGLTYPPELKTTVIVSGGFSWREIE